MLAALRDEGKSVRYATAASIHIYYGRTTAPDSAAGAERPRPNPVGCASQLERAASNFAPTAAQSTTFHHAAR